MKKILLFTDSLGAGGAQRQLVGLAVLLKENNFQVKVCTYHKIDFYKNYLDVNNIENEVIPNAYSIPKRIWNIYMYFKHEKPDCVIAYQETPSLITCVCRLIGCKFKLVVSERNTTQKISYRDRIRFFLYRFANYIVPNSYTQGNFLMDKYPWMKSKIKIITNFVDLEIFNYTEKNVCKKPLIIIVASVWPPKNTKRFIKAIHLLKNKGVYFNVEWYGIDETNKIYYKECIELINEFDLTSIFKFYPKSKEIQNKYKVCDFFCLPSLYEGTPNVICEAMSVGRPIICSNVCDNSIYVEDCVNGFLFDPSNPNDIANAINKALLLNNTDYCRMCYFSRQKAESLFSRQTFINKYIELL